MKSSEENQEARDIPEQIESIEMDVPFDETYMRKDIVIPDLEKGIKIARIHKIHIVKFKISKEEVGRVKQLESPLKELFQPLRQYVSSNSNVHIEGFNNEMANNGKEIPLLSFGIMKIRIVLEYSNISDLEPGDFHFRLENTAKSKYFSVFSNMAKLCEKKKKKHQSFREPQADAKEIIQDGLKQLLNNVDNEMNNLVEKNNGYICIRENVKNDNFNGAKIILIVPIEDFHSVKLLVKLDKQLYPLWPL